MYILAKYGSEYGGNGAADIYRQVEQGEESVDIASLARMELIAAKGAHARLNSALFDFIHNMSNMF